MPTGPERLEDEAAPRGEFPGAVSAREAWGRCRRPWRVGGGREGGASACSALVPAARAPSAALRNLERAAAGTCLCPKGAPRARPGAEPAAGRAFRIGLLGLRSVLGVRCVPIYFRAPVGLCFSLVVMKEAVLSAGVTEGGGRRCLVGA